MSLNGHPGGAPWRRWVGVHVEVGQRGNAVGEMQWDVSEWDDTTWSGLEPSFRSLDAWEVEQVTTERGRERGLQRAKTGTAEVVLAYRGAAGRWSMRPTAPARLGEEMRIRAVSRQVFDGGALVVPVFRGAVREIRDGWDPEGTFRVTIRLVDRFADLASVDLPALASVEGLGDLTHERIARIMDKAGVDPYYLAHGETVVQHQSSNFARNMLDEAQVAVESEMGDFYVDRDGFFFVRPRYGDPGYTSAREDEPQLLWTNVEDEADGIGPTSFGTRQALDDVRNQVSFAKSGGAAITVSDTDSILTFGLRTHQRFDLTCRFDADVETAAGIVLAELKDRTQRIESVAARVDVSPGRFPLVDVEIGDRQDVLWTDGEQLMAGIFHVQGIQHRITGHGWWVTVNLWAFAGNGLKPVGDEHSWGFGRWGEARWQSV